MAAPERESKVPRPPPNAAPPEQLALPRIRLNCTFTVNPNSSRRRKKDTCELPPLRLSGSGEMPVSARAVAEPLPNHTYKTRLKTYRTPRSQRYKGTPTGVTIERHEDREPSLRYSHLRASDEFSDEEITSLSAIAEKSLSSSSSLRCVPQPPVESARASFFRASAVAYHEGHFSSATQCS